MSRRRTLALAGLLAAALGADWPQFLGPARDGRSPETGLRTDWPGAGPPRLWRRDVGEGYSSPVVAGGRLVLFHRLGGEEVVEGLDAATGRGLWKFSYPSAYEDAFGKGDGPRATPLVAGGQVYTLGAAGVLTCLGLEDGKKLWQRPLLEEYAVRPNFFGVGGSPLLEGGLLLLNVGGRGAGVVALDKDTGKERWRATDHEASYASPVAATIGGARHALFFTREGLVSVDPADGRVRFTKRWRARISASVNAATPLVAGDLVFLTAAYNTGAVLLRVKGGAAEEVWKGDEILSCHYNTPVIHDGFLYGCDGRQDTGPVSLRCVELATGKVRWTRERFGCAALIAAEGNLYALDEAGELAVVACDPAGYRERARARILDAAPCRAQPALAGGRLYARDARTLGCWDLKKK
jgi:outer membrane protein assembly factor BamB